MVNYNLAEMQENIRSEFESMLRFVTSKEVQNAGNAKAYKINLIASPMRKDGH